MKKDLIPKIDIMIIMMSMMTRTHTMDTLREPLRRQSGTDISSWNLNTFTTEERKILRIPIENLQIDTIKHTMMMTLKHLQVNNPIMMMIFQNWKTQFLGIFLMQHSAIISFMIKGFQQTLMIILRKIQNIDMKMNSQKVPTELMMITTLQDTRVC